MNTVHEFVKAYSKLYEIMMGVCEEEHAPIYTAMAMREILGFDQYYTLESLEIMKVAIHQLNIYLDVGNFECECSDESKSPVCFACNVDEASKNIIKAKEKLTRKGVVNDSQE